MITDLPRNQPLVDESGKLTERSLKWTQDVTKLQILSGAGSPEGVILTEITSLYMDTAGATGSILYIKRDTDIAGDRTMGWILV